MELYTVIPSVGVVEPVDPTFFKELYPQIKEPPNESIITNRPHTKKGKKALLEAEWIEVDGVFIPPISDYQKKNQKYSRKKKKQKKSS